VSRKSDRGHIRAAEQVLALAPDSAPVKAGQSFGNPFLRLIEAFLL
jgi:hypothetical protein